MEQRRVISKLRRIPFNNVVQTNEGDGGTRNTYHYYISGTGGVPILEHLSYEYAGFKSGPVPLTHRRAGKKSGSHYKSLEYS